MPSCRFPQRGNLPQVAGKVCPVQRLKVNQHLRPENGVVYKRRHAGGREMRIHVCARGPGEILKHRVRASVSFRPGGEVQTAGPVAEPAVFRGQNRILAGVGAQRGGGDLGQPVLGQDVLGVQVPPPE